MSPVVTVGIPVLDGARYLDEVLSVVRAQELPAGAELEILIVDSGSTDGSLDIARRHGAVVHEIPRSEFSHGGTRNQIMRLARGSHVAYLTQDATPADERWLAALLLAFDAAPDVGATFGPHRARPDARHMVAADLDQHFAMFGDGVTEDVQRLDRSPEGILAYRQRPARLSFLSSVNFCLARWAWERFPFRDVPYAEDQLLGRELIEGGLAKVYAPGAAVLHSHDYPALTFLRRYFDEWRSLREVLGFVQPVGPRRNVRDVRGLIRRDERWLRAHGVGGPALARALAVSAGHHVIRVGSAVVGTRADRVPAPLRRALSLEGRDTFAPATVPSSPILADTGKVLLDPDWGYEFVRRAHPLGPVLTEPRPGPVDGPLRLAWVIPTWNVGSGGHMSIFRLVKHMEERGHRCALFVVDPFGRDDRPAHELRSEIRERFVPIEAPVFRDLDGFDSADICFATNWWTAWPVRDLPRCREKVYLVQDDEPTFSPLGSETIWAEETYRMGYRCLAAYTNWMADVLRDRYGLEVREFDGGGDLDAYPFSGEEGREPEVVAVYARRETPRRAVELALAALGLLFERRPGLRVELFGTNRLINTPVPAVNHGVLPPAELSRLYRRAQVGLCLSLTNISLATQEMMASGLPVVELDGENVTSALGANGELAALAAPHASDLADAVERLLDDRAAAAAMAVRARAWVEQRTWTRAADQVEAALREFLASPRNTVASRQT